MASLRVMPENIGMSARETAICSKFKVSLLPLREENESLKSSYCVQERMVTEIFERLRLSLGFGFDIVSSAWSRINADIRTFRR